MSQYRKFLTGARVVLVGPANTLNDRGMGDFIDAHDVVVRLNHAWPLPADRAGDIGRRTDILYHNLNPKRQRFGRKDARRMHDEGIRWVVSTHPAVRIRYRRRQRRVRRALKGLVGFRAVPLAVKRRLRPHVGSANGGLIAVIDLLRLPIESLYVTGFSFYQTSYLNYPKYRRAYAGNARRHHNQRRHKAFFARLLAREPRLSVDAAMAELLAAHLAKRRIR